MSPTSTPPYTPNELMPAMPVLADLHDALGGLSRSTSGFVGLQHLFGSTATLIHSLVDGVVNPEDVLLLGKPYSTNPGVQEHLQARLGYAVHPDCARQPVAEANDEVMDRRIHELLDQLLQRHRAIPYGRHRRIVLIDDGGRAIKQLHDDRYRSIRPFVSCVEQTRCGIRTLADVPLEVPVVNVAESWAKLEYESPLIASSVQQQLELKLHGLSRAGIPVPDLTLIIGFGAIGRAVARVLRMGGRKVAIFDRAESRRQAAAEEGYLVFADLGEGLRRGGVIVGCTGLPTVGPSDYDEIASGSILISASSSDVEFQAWILRRRGICQGDPTGWASPDAGHASNSRSDHPCFSLYRIDAARGAFFLVNGGFPVNFDGGVDTICPELIQLTRSLLYAGCVQASHIRTPGIIDLDEVLQERIVAQWTESRLVKVA